MKAHLLATILIVGVLACSGGSTASTCPATAPLDCQDGKCCSDGYPYHCASTAHCWQTASAAQQDCGTSYTSCTGASGSGGTDGGSSSGSSGTGGTGGSSGAGGSMGSCGTCSGNLQCSQWIQGTACNWQSCACYFTLNGSDTWKEYYHTSSGQCFQCSTTGTTCQSAAQALVNQCYGL
jgi:hypothetical protein